MQSNSNSSTKSDYGGVSALRRSRATSFISSIGGRLDQPYEFKEESLPFIVYEPDQKKFKLTKEATDLLAAIPGPLGVVAVAGLYRTGKSYLLNRMLLNRSDGFGVGPTINPCTKGLWIWGKPIPGFTPEGDPINVLIVDTEGLGALDEDSNHDVRIFSLAILLSSFFIYNSVGSIDESALSNLSLVINLTKNIQLKSGSKPGEAAGVNDETDFEEYGVHFPSFVWVVRDFTLQLVDTEGEPITSKDYLEKALDIQKGYSDAVEQKNRIRRLMKQFFKDRDCCTMIRPLTNEENLQNLANMELEELRADFVEQVMNLRRKVINRVKVKTLNGKALSGPMLSTLADTYVSAINNGAVPNIETAWTYICRNECQKAQEEALSLFENCLREFSLSRVPSEPEDISAFLKQAKNQAIESFKLKAVGQNQEYLIELKVRLSKMSESLKEENERTAYQSITHFLHESYHFIERKIKNREIPGGLTEYLEVDMRQFQTYFMDNGPAGPNRQLILMDFVARATAEAAEFFARGLSSELDLQKQIFNEQKKHLEGQLKEHKADSYKERELLETRLRLAESEKADLSGLEITLRETINLLQAEKLTQEKDWQQQAKLQKGQYSRDLEEYRAKITSQDSMIQELQRKLIQSESEQDKEFALLAQKAEFLERTIQEYQQKENSYNSEQKSQKREHQQMLREIQAKHDLQVRDLQSRLDDLQDQLLDANGQLDSLQQRYAFDKQLWEDSQLQLKDRASLSQEQFDLLQQELEEARFIAQEEQDRLTVELTEIREISRYKQEDLEDTIKDKEEELKTLRISLDKELAIFNQKLEFKDVQCQQLKLQLEESRNTHDQMIKAIENKAKESVDGRENAQKKVSEIRDQHMLEVREMETKHAQVKATLEQAMESLNEKYAELDLKYKILVDEHTSTTQQLKSQVESLDNARIKALEQSKSQDSQKLKLLEEAESRHRQLIDSLERDLEERETKAAEELRDLQAKSEESLQQLRNFYEFEKERLETRLLEERERSQKRAAQLSEEMENQLQDEQTQHEEDMELLQEELRENERRNLAYQQQSEHERAMISQRCEQLEAYAREKEDRLAKEQQMISTQIDAQIERFNQERKELFTKIDGLTMSVTAKDRDLTLAQNRLETLQEEVERRRRQIDEIRNEMHSEKQKLNDKVEKERARNQEIADLQITQKLEDAREIALYKQKLEFMQKKIDELQKSSDEQYQKFEERLSSQKGDYQQEVLDYQTRFAQHRDQAEAKYEAKRRQFKEQEQALLRQLAESNKERAILEEKLSSLLSRRDENKGKNETEISSLKDSISALNEQISRERDAYLQENDKLKAQMQDQERQLLDVSAAYERDRALWENKFTFLEQNRDQAKSDLQEAQKKFTQTLDQLQKRGNAEKDRNETVQSSLITSIESKFKQQFKENSDSWQRERAEMQDKLRTLEKDNRALQTRIQLEQRDKFSEQGSLQKRLGDSLEAEGRIQRELDDLKVDRDRRHQELQRTHEKEREQMRGKINDIENRAKEAEHKRSQMIFDIEKDNAMWVLEKNHILQQKQELQENLEKFVKKNEDLLKENEKLKTDRNLRKQQQYSGMFSGSNPPGSANQSRYMGAKLGLMNAKENLVTASQIFTPGAKYIGDGSSSQGDQTAPFTVRDNNLPLQSTTFATNIRARLGSPTQSSSSVMSSQFIPAGSLPQISKINGFGIQSSQKSAQQSTSTLDNNPGKENQGESA